MSKTPTTEPRSPLIEAWRTNWSERLPASFGAFSFGCWLILLCGAVAGAVLATSRPAPKGDLDMWIFAQMHEDMYRPILKEWNAQHEQTIGLTTLGLPALERRLLSGFYGGLPTADLIEVERAVIGQVFSGPLESVGFVDLTDRVLAEKLDEEIVSQSFSPWTSRGRIFGLPHDVHPVLLAVRADLIAEAGIDLSQIQTWEDFARVMRPLMDDLDGDGEPDRYLLGVWPTHPDKLEMMLLQGGTGLFDEAGRPTIATEANARVLATIISWCGGPDRIAADVPDFTGAGNRLKTEGYAVAFFCPDWMCRVWKREMPEMAGKLEIIPLPAWEPGGRRASVWGGTMLGIPKTCSDIEEAWNFAKHLYASPDLARRLYLDGDIVTPIKRFWSDPIYDEPDPFFRGQAKGRLYVDFADDVPPRKPSPYNPVAVQGLVDAATGLYDFAQARNTWNPDSLHVESMRRLQAVERRVSGFLERNVFLGGQE